VAHSSYRVHVTKDYLVFSSAHFITFAGHRCESLHGHNYRVGVTLDGALLPEGWYVLDFSEVKQRMKRLCDEIDHKVLLPLSNPKLTIAETDDLVSVAYLGAPRYVFPRRDCALLPIPNTTVEQLANYLCHRLLHDLPDTGRLTSVEVEVEENFGQSAVFCERLNDEVLGATDTR
jgi:6-pyruvoyltetrahydropterin/6-carboxytetrahydropterin synthase